MGDDDRTQIRADRAAPAHGQVGPGEDERRFMPRVAWETEVEVHVGAKRVRCSSVDISQTGLRLRGSWSGYRGQSVQIKLELEGEPVHAFGEVVWSSQQSAEGWGVRFTTVHPSARRRIARFVIASLKGRATRNDVDPMPVTPQPRAPTTTPAPSRRTTPEPNPPLRADAWPVAPSATRAPAPAPAAPWARSPVAPPLGRTHPAPLTPPPPPVKTPPPDVIPCNPTVRSRIQELLDSGLASGSIVSGAKEAMSGRGDLYVRVGSGPVVVLPAEDPLTNRLRWLAAAVATWSSDEDTRLHHGPATPLRIRI